MCRRMRCCLQEQEDRIVGKVTAESGDETYVWLVTRVETLIGTR